MKTSDLVDEILDGKRDADLKRINDAVIIRNRHLRERILGSLKVGDKVRFNSETRPNYLIGCDAIVRGFVRRGGKIIVSLVGGARGKFSGESIRTSPSLIELVPKEQQDLAPAPSRRLRRLIEDV